MRENYLNEIYIKATQDLVLSVKIIFSFNYISQSAKTINLNSMYLDEMWLTSSVLWRDATVWNISCRW